MAEQNYIKEHKKQYKKPCLKRLTKKGIYNRKQSYKLKNKEKAKPRHQPVPEETDTGCVCHRCIFISDEPLVYLPATFIQVLICTECYQEILEAHKR